MSDPKSLYTTLPKKRMAAGALFLDQRGHLLLVNPTIIPTEQTLYLE